MEADSFFPSEFTNYEYIYNNENNIAQLQVPLSISYFNVPKFANELYTDTDTTYFTYSGDWNSLIVSREKDGRYKNLSMRAYSGDSFKFYFSTGLGFSTGASYYSGPLTISGAYSKLTMYSGEADAITNAITFSAPTDNSVVYTLPFVENINWIRLHHKEAVSGESYRLYQFLPRTLIQVDDLEADVIDAVTIRVSDSIVIGPNLIGDKTILGQKIVDGTLSGILLTDGTITGTKVQARTISGILITAGTIKGENIEAATISGSLITANTITAGKIAAGTITFNEIASNTLTSGQIADGTITGKNILAGTVSGVLITNNSITATNIAGATITGDKIVARTISGALITAGTIKGENIEAATISGSLITANTITANKLTVDKLSAITSNMGQLFVTEKLEVTSGYLTAGISRIDNTGIKIGSVNAALDASSALRIYGSGTVGNIVGMAFYNGSYSASNPQITIQADSTNALEIENNAPNGITNFNFIEGGNNSVNVYNADINLKRTPSSPADVDAGAIYSYDSDNTRKYLLSGSEFVLRNNSNIDTVNINNATGNISALGDFAINTNKFTVAGTTGNTLVAGTLDVTGQTTAGALRASGAIGFGASYNKFTVAAATGNTAVAGTLTSTGKFTASDLAYGTFTRTADLAITTAGTTITWQGTAPRSNNMTYSTTDITVGNTGYYLITAYFATLGNVSLRMTLQRSSANYTSIQQVTPLSTGGGYIFNFSNAMYLAANSVLKVILTPSANTTLIQNAESGAAPSPFIHIIQLAGI